MDISYDYYRIFYYVASCGSVSQAAVQLRNNQPNLTRAIKNLEGELGCTLFLRTNRGMRLTPEGERLFAHIRVAFQQIERGEAELQELRELRRGSVTISASEIALRGILQPVLRKFCRLHPNVSLKISNHTTPQAVEALKNGLADLAVVTTPLTPEDGLRFRRLRSVRERAVCAGFPELVVPQENRDKAAQYILRVNYEMRYARLDMDWETGEVNSFVSIPSYDVIPSQSEIDGLLVFAYSVLEEYGDGLKRVAELGADPEAAYVEASME